MRSRWWHTPVLHSPHPGSEKKVTWLELFYDLIFVAAFIQLGNGLSAHVSVLGFLRFSAVFVPMWLVWTGLTFFTNRFSVDDIAHRLIVIAQMFSVGVMSMSAADVLDGRPTVFACAYAVAQSFTAILYLRAYRQVPEGRAFSRHWGLVFAVGAVLWTISVFLPSPWNYALWVAGLAEILIAPFRRYSRVLNERYPNDEHHLTERYGLLTIIVLGESFVKVLSSLAGSGHDIFSLLQASFVLLITCCLWWVYFDDVGGSKIRKGRLSPIIWLYGHIPLQIGIVACGVAIKKAVGFELDGIAPPAYRWLLSGTLAIAMASVALVDSVTERRHAELSDRMRVNVRMAAAIILLVLAPAGGAMNAGLYLALVTAICVAQVVFDMMMAPFEAIPEHHSEPSLGDRIRAKAQATSLAQNRRSLGEAVRKGTPSELRRDLYFYFMEGGWTRVLIVFAFLFVISNVFFAALFTLVPGCIDGARPSSFGDAFFFSVQTMSTIGYGAMSPTTAYGHAIVTIEAAAGMFGVALATGLLFAKASRARASVLFSNRCVITHLHGKPTLVLRVGNARGNDVVDATVSVTVLMDELSVEGHHLRRVRDLKLERSRTPIFVLSWVVMHVLNDNSPLRDVDWSDPPPLTIIVTITGHDGTYNDTIYARHLYDQNHIVANHHFVDVISELEDGRMMIDYSKFHDVIPDSVSDRE